MSTYTQNSSKAILVMAIVMTASGGASATPCRNAASFLRTNVSIVSVPTINSAAVIISRIKGYSQNPEWLEEDEASPTPEVITKATELIQEAAKSMPQMPRGVVSTFYGEVNVSWQIDDSVVRLACFPDKPSVVQVGQVSVPGSYRSQLNPDGKFLADQLEILLTAEDPEQPLFG